MYGLMTAFKGGSDHSPINQINIMALKDMFTNVD